MRVTASLPDRRPRGLHASQVTGNCRGSRIGGVTLLWDRRYDTARYVYGKEPNQFLVEHLGSLRKGKALCVAEGEGRNAVFLARNGFTVTAVDSSTVGLQKAQRLAEENGVQIATVVSDLAHYEILPDSWDSVISVYAHVPKEVRLTLHARIVSGLKKNGIFLLEAYTPEQLKYGTGGPPDVTKLMGLDDLRRELDGLDILLGREILREVVEGHLHTGMGAVVQFIGRKP